MNRTISRTTPLAQRLLGALLANRLVNPTLASDHGRALYGKLLFQLFFRRRWAPSVHATLFRNLVLRASTLQPYRRQRFRRRYGFLPPIAAMIAVTSRCNLSCAGCFANGWDGHAELSYERVKALLAELDSWGAQLCVIGGGEPLCWPSFFTMLEEHPHMSFLVYTNGTLIDPSAARRLARLGNVLMAVSVDGFEADHDARRGRGSFARALQGLQHLNDAGALSAFSVTLTRQNHDATLSDAFIAQFDALNCFMGFYLGYMPVDEGGSPELMPTPAQRAYRLSRLAELQRTSRIVLLDFTNAGPVANGCGAAGRMYFHINPQGDVEPCPFCHFATHNVHSCTLLDALRSPFFAAFRTYHATQHDPRLPCPIIDQPNALRRIVANTNARPTHPAATKILSDFAPHLDQSAVQFAELLSCAQSASLSTTVRQT